MGRLSRISSEEVERLKEKIRISYKNRPKTMKRLRQEALMDTEGNHLIGWFKRMDRKTVKRLLKLVRVLAWSTMVSGIFLSRLDLFFVGLTVETVAYLIQVENTESEGDVYST